ncbi:MAG: hypothetical protein WCJ63_07045 [Actinomycetes bacterium]
MDSQTNIPAQAHSTAGISAQPCRGCGASVAEDQRYCVGCGYRRPDKALPFAGVGAGAAVAATVDPPAKSKQAISPALAAAIVCLSVLFLGTGVLVGRSAGGSQQVAAAPQAVTTVAAAAGDATATPSGAAAAGAAKASTKAAPTAVAKVPKGAKVLDKASITSATDCNGLTPAACSKKLAKLPKTIVTPGAPPPKDGKAPAGGGGGTTFN